MPFGDEKDQTRGGVTFRQVCGEFGLDSTVCRRSMAHVPRDIGRRFRDRWADLLYEGSGVPRDVSGQAQHIVAPGRVMTPEGRAQRYGTLAPEQVRDALPLDARLALSLSQIAKRLGMAATKDNQHLKRALLALEVSGEAMGTTTGQVRDRRVLNPRIRYYRVA